MLIKNCKKILILLEKMLAFNLIICYINIVENKTKGQKYDK